MKTDSFPRRRFLQGGLAAAALFPPSPWAWVRAQSDGAVKLLRAPKLALVMGNAAYRGVPALRNPGNDSHAIARALGEAGFEVTRVQDAGRETMLAAIDQHAKALAARKLPKEIAQQSRSSNNIRLQSVQCTWNLSNRQNDMQM